MISTPVICNDYFRAVTCCVPENYRELSKIPIDYYAITLIFQGAFLTLFIDILCEFR